MPINVSCPACAYRGQVPDDMPARSVLTCQVCGLQSPLAAVLAPTLTGIHEAGGWVGDTTALAPSPVAPSVLDPHVLAPETATAHLDRVLAELARVRDRVAAFESEARVAAERKERDLARDRAALDARAVDLDAREATLVASLNRQAHDIQSELDRRVAVERENLARRAEELARAERSLERRARELDEIEQDVRREAENDVAKRLNYTPLPRLALTLPPQLATGVASG